MMGNKARLGIGAAAATAIVMAVAGCSGSNSGAGASGTGAAGQNTGAAIGGDGAAMTLVSDVMNKAGSAGTVRISGTVTSAKGGTTSISGQEQYSPNLELSITSQVQGQSISEVLVGDVFYMNYPELSAEMGGKPWAKIDLSKANGSLGSLSSLFDSAKNLNPTTQIEALIASGNVTEVGTETVDGQQTTHYSGKLDAAQMLQQTSSNVHLTKSQLSQLKSALGTEGVTSETVNLWVGSGNLPVEVKYQIQSSAAGQISSDLHLSDWGKPVQIGAPPANEVYDMTSMMNGALASASAAG
jgi:hypothetical protein